jgi:lipopolysaccharide export system protein LptC
VARVLHVRSLLDRATAWSPVLLLGGLAALTYWLDSQVQTKPPRADGSARHDPDLFVEGFRAVELDSEGRPRQMIAGKRALHFGDDQTTEFDQPLLAQTLPGKPAFRVSATHGLLSADRKQVKFEGNVRATREADPGAAKGEAAGPVAVTTEYLQVFLDRNVARTDRPVTIEEPRGIISSVGMEIDHASKTLRLDSSVRGTLQPQVLPK